MLFAIKSIILYLRIVVQYFPHIQYVPNVVRVRGLLSFKQKLITSLVGVVLVCGLATNSSFTNLVEAFISVQNYVTADTNVEDGLEIYKYESESLFAIDTAAEFNTGTFSSANFETGENDLLVIDDTIDSITLNHYGDNAPDTSNNGEWWDDDSNTTTNYNWRYRQCFDIDYSSGAVDLTEYQLYLDFDTSALISGGLMQSQGEDIRVVDTAGNVIDHYIADDINTTSTRVWIQPDLITAGSTTNYCLYYGNPTAADTSNRENVFSYSSEQEIYFNLAEGADNTAINVGSYTFGNSIVSGTDTRTLGQYQVIDTQAGGGGGGGPTNPTFDATSPLLAKGPIQVTQEGAGVDSVVPLTLAGTDFAYRYDRNAPHAVDVYAPFCDVNVEIYNTDNLTTPVGSFTVLEGDSFAWLQSVENSGAFANNDAAYITSTNNCPFLGFHRTENNRDTFVMIPATTEDWYGVGSNRAEITSFATSNINLYNSGNNTPTAITLDSGNNFSVEDGGAGTQGTAPSQRIEVVSGGAIGAKSIADGNGNESATFLPRYEMDTKYIIPELASYVTFSSIAGVTTTIEIYNDAADCTFGNTSPLPDQSLTATSTGAAPGHALSGPVVQGACVVSNHPIALYFDKDNGSEETSLWSYKQGRPRAEIEPTPVVGSVQTGSWNLGTGSTWDRRIPVTVTNNVSSAINEYPVRITLDGQTDILTNAQADGGDIRIAGSVGDGSDNQDYYLEEFGNIFANNGDIWTQVDVAGSSSETIYIYYNSNNTETDLSSQDDVFTYTSQQPLYYPVTSFNNGNAINIYSIVPDNILTFDGTTYTDLDPGENYNDPGVTVESNFVLDQGDSVSVLGPINATADSDATDALAPISWAGTLFLDTEGRRENEYTLLAPFADSTVTFEISNGSGWTSFGTPVSLTQGVVQNVIRDIRSDTTNTPFVGVRITSTTPILIHRHANEGGVPFGDSYVLYPANNAFEESSGNYELFGVNSADAVIIGSNTSTSVTIHKDDGTSTGPITLDSATNNLFQITGGADQGAGDGYRVIANGPIAVHSIADADGNEGAVFLPKKEFAKEFLIINPAQYISVVSDTPSTVCEVFDETGSSVTSQTLTTNNSPFVNFTVFGNTTTNNPAVYPREYYMICSDPVYAYYEKNSDDTNTDYTDETNFLSFPQARKRALVEPIVTDLDDISAVEEGLYYESGFDSATTGLDPEATVSFILNGSGLPNATHVAWNDFSWLLSTPTQTTNNSVSPFEVTVFAGDSIDCGVGTTYTTLGTLSQSGDEIPITASDNRCLGVDLTFRTGDAAYSPELTNLTLSFTLAELVQDIFTANTISIDGNISAQSRNRRILKYITSNSNLASTEHYLEYISGTNTADFTNWDMDIVELSTSTATNQFDYPAFPVTPPSIISNNTTVFSDTQANAVYLDHERSSGSSSTFEMNSFFGLVGSTTSTISRPFTLDISGT